MWGWFCLCFITPGYEHFFCIITKINFIFFMLSEIILCFFTGISLSSWNQTHISHWICILMFVMVLSAAPISYECRYFTVPRLIKYLEQFFIDTLLIESKWQPCRWHPLPYKMAVLEKKGFCINFCWKCGRTATNTWDATTSTRRNSTEFIQDMWVVL